MSKRSIAASGLLLVIMLLATVYVSAQTPSELRKKYGEPLILKMKDKEPEVERYNVSPSIRLTVTYAKKGQPYELLIEPVPSPAPDPSHGDLMPTETVINLINELAPVSLCGKQLSVGKFNAGDPEMKLDHLGCAGAYYVIYEHVDISCWTWCWGGTFSAHIRWQEYKPQPSERKNER